MEGKKVRFYSATRTHPNMETVEHPALTGLSPACIFCELEICYGDDGFYDSGDNTSHYFCMMENLLGPEWCELTSDHIRQQCRHYESEPKK
jgi:hypothetical protein